MNENITLERTPKSIATVIAHAEFNLQDKFLEYRDIFADSRILMEFALSKGHISQDKYELWKEGFEANEMGAMENFEVILGEDQEENPYCIAYEEDGTRPFDEYVRALMVYGELIASREDYFDAFLKELTSEDGNLQLLEVKVN